MTFHVYLSSLFANYPILINYFELLRGKMTGLLCESWSKYVNLQDFCRRWALEGSAQPSLFPFSFVYEVKQRGRVSYS